MRQFGVAGRLMELPGPLIVLFSLVTQLGDIWVLGSLTLGAYWLGPHAPRVGHALTRERGAVVLALLFGTVALVTTLKPLFGLPRPPGAGVPPRAETVPAALEGVYAWLSTGEGFGFPSGHALGSTVVFGGLAWALRAGEWQRRAALAAGLVVLVSLSRLVLGLHYLGDVLAGAAIGMTFLGVVLALGSPGRAFSLVAAIGVVGLAVAGPTRELVAASGLCVGGAAAWTLGGDRLLATPTRGGALATAVIGVVLVGPLLGVVVAGLLPVWASLAVGFVGGVTVVALPLVGERVTKNDGGRSGSQNFSR